MAVNDDNTNSVVISTSTEDVTIVEPYGEANGSFKAPVVSVHPNTRHLTINVIYSLMQQPRASVSYLPLFLIQGVDTKSRAYLKSTRVIPEITAVTSSSKRPRSSLTVAHKLVNDEAACKSTFFFYSYSIFTLYLFLSG